MLNKYCTTESHPQPKLTLINKNLVVLQGHPFEYQFLQCRNNNSIWLSLYQLLDPKDPGGFLSASPTFRHLGLFILLFSFSSQLWVRPSYHLLNSEISEALCKPPFMLLPNHCTQATLERFVHLRTCTQILIYSLY